MAKIEVPEVLPTSPLSLACPFCKAKPGKDCTTSKGGFAAVHVARVAAAAAVDAKNRKSREEANLGAAPVVRKARKE